MPTTKTTTAGARTQEPTESESKILALLDNYHAAVAELEQVRTDKLGKPEPLPVPCSIETYREIHNRNFDAERAYERREREARTKANEADWALFKAMPHLVWIALPSRGISIGFSTGTWGGHCHALQVAKDGDALPKLEHQTYYP